jgi:hypothetical protein
MTLQDILIILFFVHGIAHLPGVIVPWRIAVLREVPYKTTLLSGRIHLSKKGVKFIGLLWLLASLTFILAGIGLFIQSPWWKTLTYIVTIFSIVLCIVDWPDARFGVFINAAIFIILLFIL